jgi:predicted nucleic acid-binding protein
MILPPRGRKILFDTNVYIEAIQSGPATDIYHLLLTTIPRTYLSAVVVQELYAGALDTVGERLVARFVHQTERTSRLVIPTYRDWSEAGHVLARINRQEPAQRTRLARLVNDVLLAMSARQIGATLYTFNRDDFTLIARYKTFSFVLLSCRASSKTLASRQC